MHSLQKHSENTGFWFSPSHYDVKTQVCTGLLPEPGFFMFSCCQDEAWMESSSWQQEHMQKHRFLATARGRTRCFYSYNGSETTRTLCFCMCFWCQDEDFIQVSSWQQETVKKTGFWLRLYAEPCVFTFIMARRKPEPYVFTVILEWMKPEPYIFTLFLRALGRGGRGCARQEGGVPPYEGQLGTIWMILEHLK